MYNLCFQKPPTLIERALRLEIGERIAADGEVLLAPDMAELRALAETLERERVESVTVCLLHSYAFPQHEQLIGDFLRRRLPHMLVSLSHEVRRLTSLPASRLGLRDRGIVRTGARADLAIFDPAIFAERGTTFAPNQTAVGMRHVLVNGGITLRDGVLSGNRSGQVLRKA